MTDTVTYRPGLIDRMIASVWPERGYRRIMWKQVVAREYAKSSARRYDIGRTGRTTEGWLTTNGSATAEVSAVAQLARRRSRDLVQNNAYAASAISKLTAKIIGTGITPRLEGISKLARRQAMSDWNAFSDHCDPSGMVDYYGVQSQIIRCVIESGEALVVYDPQPSIKGLTIPLRMRVLEPDYLDSSRNIPLNDGGAIINGVEFNADGERAAYWLFDRHPGEALAYGRNGLISRRIDAAYVDHVFDILRPGQARGITWFAPVALKLRDIGDYEEAELVRKKIEACAVAFVTRTGSAASLTQEGIKNDADTGKPIERIEPGMILYGRPGEGVNFNNPSASPGVTEHLVQQLHAIAAGVGTPYFMMTGDVSQTNYSSARAAMLDFWDLLDRWQYLMFIPQQCRKTWGRFAKYRAAATGKTMPEGSRVLWTPPTRPLIDPLKDASAEKALIRSGIKTLRQSIAERGDDPGDVLQEIADTNAEIDALGLTLDCDPRRVQDSGKAQQDAAALAQQNA